MTGAGPAMAGLVTAFDEHVGLGTVTAHGIDYPFHCTQIAGGSRTIAVGAEVRFEVGAGHLGRWEAAGVTPVSATS